MKEQQKSPDRAPDRAMEDAVSRALRDNLGPLQRTADELHQAYADLVSACSSTRPSNALPAMLRAQTAAAALAAGLSVLSNFVTVALNPRESGMGASAAHARHAAPVEEVDEEERRPARGRAAVETEEASEWAEEPPVVPAPAPAAQHARRGTPVQPQEIEPEDEPIVEAIVELEEEPAAPAAAAFDVANLPGELQDLHRRANRVAKVAMQDIKMLRPKDVRLGCEHKDICNRLRSDLDKARKEYDRRFRAILDHPVDYFHRWMVEILAEGDSTALGEYPYPSPVLRHS